MIGLEVQRIAMVKCIYIPTRYAMLIEGEAVGLVLVSLLTKRDALRLSLLGSNCRICRSSRGERDETGVANQSASNGDVKRKSSRVVCVGGCAHTRSVEVQVSTRA